jgi:hypothetical protein
MRSAYCLNARLRTEFMHAASKDCCRRTFTDITLMYMLACFCKHCTLYAMHYRLRDAAHLLLAVAAPGIDTSSKYFTGVLTGSPSLRMSETEKQVTAASCNCQN